MPNGTIGNGGIFFNPLPNDPDEEFGEFCGPVSIPDPPSVKVQPNYNLDIDLVETVVPQLPWTQSPDPPAVAAVVHSEVEEFSEFTSNVQSTEEFTEFESAIPVITPSKSQEFVTEPKIVDLFDVEESIVSTPVVLCHSSGTSDLLDVDGPIFSTPPVPSHSSPANDLLDSIEPSTVDLPVLSMSMNPAVEEIEDDDFGDFAHAVPQMTVISGLPTESKLTEVFALPESSPEAISDNVQEAHLAPSIDTEEPPQFDWDANVPECQQVNYTLLPKRAIEVIRCFRYLGHGIGTNGSHCHPNGGSSK